MGKALIEMRNMRITAVTRADIMDYLLARDEPFHGKLEIISFLKRIWPLDQMPSTDRRFRNATEDIWQHTVN